LQELPPPTPPFVSNEAFQQGMTLRRNGDYAHAADSFRAVLNGNPNPELARQAQFHLGESLALAHDNANATAALTTLINANGDDELARRARYFLADLYTTAHSYSQAIEQLRAYRAQTYALMGEIDSQIADVMLAAGDNVSAIAQYGVALQDQTLTASQRVDILKKLADVYSKSGQPTLAAARLGEAFNLATTNASRADVEYRWGLALDAAQQHSAALTHWRHALAAYVETDGAFNSLLQMVNAGESVDDYQRGVADYYHGSYDLAIAALNRYIKANPNHTAEPHYFVALSYQKNGSSANAIKVFDEIIQTHPKDKRVPDAWYNKAAAQSRLGDAGAAAATYTQFAALYPSDSRAADALWTAARLLDTAGRSDEALAQYQQLAAKYPASSYAPKALVNVGLDYYLAHDNASAQARWNLVAKTFPNSTEADRARYWLAKLAQARGDNSAAMQLFRQVAQPPRSYYSWRALDVLEPDDAPISYDVAAYSMTPQPEEVKGFEVWLAGWNPGGDVSSELSAAILGDFHFRRGVELSGLDRFNEAHAEFSQVLDRFNANPRALYSLARYLQDNNYYDLSVIAARGIQKLSPAHSDEDLPRYLRQFIYPTYFADLIVPYAQRNGFDPMLFFALVRQESTFDPLSTSWVGASGLTQVMPQTGLGIAKDLGVTNYSQPDLYKPTVSIRFGTHFFGQLVKYFNGNIFYALAGYNAGPGNAKKWQRPDVDVGLEIIHLPESYLYVRTIYSQYNQYLEIYRNR
jgi:soluble lytic murein transglycosylase